MSKVQEAVDVAVDFPQEGERITSPEYTFRIEARPTQAVDVAIDNGAWQSCRQAGGHWWFDWSGYKSGKHQAIVRCRVENGKRAVMEKRRFLVALP